MSPLADQLKAYDTGAYRDADTGKVDFEGHLCPLTLEAYGEWLDTKRTMSDGSRRAADNWQLGMSSADYMRSLWRHFLQLWKLHRGHPVYKNGKPVTKREAACAILFNTFGYLRNVIVEEQMCEARR